MKFLCKNENSRILKENIKYKVGSGNKRLKRMLINEQKNFCAYTEKYLDDLDSVDIEHFDSSKKGTEADGYLNYYAVLHKVNIEKLDEKYRGAQFFNTLFFQNKEEFDRRIHYTNGDYEEINIDDKEAADFISFLGFNSHSLRSQRINHITRLKEIFADARYDNIQQKEFFLKYKDQLSFVTALEHELKIDLSACY